LIPFTRHSMACGWSPPGLKGASSLNMFWAYGFREESSPIF